MHELDELLAYLVDNVDGALAAVVGDIDGLLIEQYPKQGRDLTAVTAQWTNVQNALDVVVTSLEGGSVKEIMVTADNLIGYARLLSDGLFSFIIMNPSGNIGKARLYSEQMARRVSEVFA